jgi:hypothetical protein
MATAAGLVTLAHEFGHAFALGHSDGFPGFGNNNIMWSTLTGLVQDHFSVGQAFRINVDDNSVLNVNGVRTGQDVRDCPPATTNERCPALALDSLPH